MIYIHVPFCRSFCTYCGFYSEICSRSASQQVQMRVYTDALLQEITSRLSVMPVNVCYADPSQAGAWAPPSYGAEGGTISGITDSRSSSCCTATESKHIPVAPSPSTLYIGGGTPSILPIEELERIVAALGPAEYEEFTMEVNPDDIIANGPGYLHSLTGLGVNRISMGVQSFDDGVLRWMNRRHDADGARRAFSMMREAGVRNISIDLIFGISQLTEDQWQNTVREAIALNPEHISAYQLSIDEDSALAKMVQEGRYTEAGEEQCRTQYDMLCSMLSDAGYEHYEISNWARPGFRAVHNSAYWRRVPYWGFGPGAHSLPPSDGPLDRRCWNTQETASMDEEGKLHSWHQEWEVLSQEEMDEERVMLALRTADGICEEELRDICGNEAVDGLLDDGALVRTDAGIRIPEDHFFVSDDIIAILISHIQ